MEGTISVENKAGEDVDTNNTNLKSAPKKTLKTVHHSPAVKTK